MTTKKNLDTKTATKTKNEYIYDGMNGLERDVKRIFDFIAAAIALILFSPLFIICYILIKKEDGGSVIFKQERIGRFGRPFYIYKFRSMQEDAEKNGPALFQHERDHRLTSIGKFLRTHHLDDERYTFLYQVRPGVTSYATLYNGYTDTMDKMLRRLELDLYYLRKRSWWFDIKILINTFLNIAIGKKF